MQKATQKPRQKKKRDHHKWYQWIWKVMYDVANRFICRKFNMTHDDLKLDGPALIIPNHTNVWDPLLVAMSLRNHHAYYVGSEHVLRLGFRTLLLKIFFGPIPRRKGGSSLDAVSGIVRHLRAGHSVVLFAEGDQTWNGRTVPIFPATGKLLKVANASLVTFRVEGGYMSFPRWASDVRKGQMHGGPVRIYSPEELKTMTPEEIDEAINRDIALDAYERQKEERILYRTKTPAEGMEKALYCCPECKAIDTLRTKGDRIFCTCGFSATVDEYGFFRDGAPFETVAEWDDWQKTVLKELPSDGSGPLFSDEGVTAYRVMPDHKDEMIGEGKLIQYADRLVFGDLTFYLKDVTEMSILMTSRLLFTANGGYYEMRKEGTSLKKYLDFARR